MLTRSGFKRPQIERTRTAHTPVPEHLRRNASMTPVMTSQPAVPKTEAHRNPALLEMARGRRCLILFPYLNHDRDTTVACHSNLGEHGKAGARKADDEYSVWGCFACHSMLDQGHLTEAEKRATFTAAHGRQVHAWTLIAADPSEPARFRKAAQWALNHLIRS
jgi:Protein of unknown function (DUF1364)